MKVPVTKGSYISEKVRKGVKDSLCCEDHKIITFSVDSVEVTRDNDFHDGESVPDKKYP